MSSESGLSATQENEGSRIQVKICGLTKVEQAQRCASLGADFLGLVFYPASPRYVDRMRAREISSAVRSMAYTVGVFVNESYRTVVDIAHFCGLTAVQLHGSEPPELARRLCNEGLMVLKALFHEKEPSLAQAETYNASAFLLECGTGRLPGGNARVWDWAAAEQVDRNRPVVLAGGLAAENVARAIRLGKPDAVDVSSGVETVPGVKDMQKVAAFIAAVEKTEIDYHPKPLGKGESPC